MISARWALTLGAVAVCLAGNLPVPALDEGQWLAIAAQWRPEAPYHWVYAMPGMGAAPSGAAYGGAAYGRAAYGFAHPPAFMAWIWAWRHLSQDVAVLRWLCAIPLALGLGFAVGRIAERLTPRPLLAGALWLSLPVVGMALQRGLMPDLMVAALGTGALALWLEGPERRRLAVLGGLLLGLAVETKYPAALLGAALLLDAVRRDALRARAPFLVAAAVPVLLIEGALWLRYGQPHPMAVLGTVDEVARGPLEGRWLGLLARLPLAAPVLLLLGRGLQARWIAGFLLGGGALALGWPSELGVEARLALLGWAAGGGALLALMLQCSRDGRVPQCSIAEAERRLLAGVALLVWAGVWVGHNYASPRYLLLACAPVALLAAASARGRGLAMAVVLLQAGLSAAMLRAEARYARAAEAVAGAAAAAFPGGGRFDGDWTFRWAMERAGWTWAPGPEEGGVYVSPVQAPHGSTPEGMHELARYTSPGGGLRLLDVAAGVGLYAETLGPLPLGWSENPLEEAVIYVHDR